MVVVVVVVVVMVVVVGEPGKCGGLAESRLVMPVLQGSGHLGFHR